MYEKILEKIAAGDMELPGAGAGDPERMPRSNTETQEKVFTRSKFDHDGTRINDEEAGSLDTV